MTDFLDDPNDRDWSFQADTQGVEIVDSVAVDVCLGCEECRGYDEEMGQEHCNGSGILPARPLAEGRHD